MDKKERDKEIAAVLDRISEATGEIFGLYARLRGLQDRHSLETVPPSNVVNLFSPNNQKRRSNKPCSRNTRKPS